LRAGPERRNVALHSGLLRMAKAISPAITQALAQLRQAVTTLESVVARRAEDDRTLDLMKKELALMQDERAKLAGDLDSALAKATRLDAVTGELARRVERATTTVREVLSDLTPRS